MLVITSIAGFEFRCADPLATHQRRTRCSDSRTRLHVWREYAKPTARELSAIGPGALEAYA